MTESPLDEHAFTPAAPAGVRAARRIGPAGAIALAAAAGVVSAQSPERPAWTYEAISAAAALPVEEETGPRLEGRIQFRYVFSHRERPPPTDDTSGFTYRRVRLGVAGDLNDWISYKVEGSFDRRTGLMNLSDASIHLALADRWALHMGRFRPAFMREEIVSSARQLLVDRSLVALTFRQARSTGLELTYAYDDLKLMASVTDRGQGLGGDAAWAYIARAEWRLAGDWKSFRDFTADDERPFALLLGGAVSYEHADFLDPGLPDPHHVRWTVDASAEYDETAFFAAVIGNHADPGDGSARLDQYGVVLQAGYHVTDPVELVARFEWGDADGVAKALNVGSIGVNYYIAEHLLKFTADVGYGFNEVNGFWSSSGAGWLTDRAGHDGQIVVRVQFQVLF